MAFRARPLTPLSTQAAQPYGSSFADAASSSATSSPRGRYSRSIQICAAAGTCARFASASSRLQKGRFRGHFSRNSCNSHGGCSLRRPKATQPAASGHVPAIPYVILCTHCSRVPVAMARWQLGGTMMHRRHLALPTTTSWRCPECLTRSPRTTMPRLWCARSIDHGRGVLGPRPGQSLSQQAGPAREWDSSAATS